MTIAEYDIVAAIRPIREFVHGVVSDQFTFMRVTGFDERSWPLCQDLGEYEDGGSVAIMAPRGLTLEINDRVLVLRKGGVSVIVTAYPGVGS